MVAIFATLVVPRFLTQNEKANAAEAVNTMGALRRGMLQFNDERSAWYNPGAVCTDSTTIAAVADNLGINVTAACDPASLWTYQITDSANDFIITATRRGGSFVNDTLTLTFTKATRVTAWNGTGTFARTGANWPSLP